MTENRFKIRDTGVSYLEVIKLISKGYDVEAVLKKYPKLNQEDIYNVLKTADELLTRQMILDSYLAVNDKLKKLLKNLEDISTAPISRKNKDWSDLELKELKNLYKSGAEPAEISRILIRSIEEIKAKLKVLKIKRG